MNYPQIGFDLEGNSSELVVYLAGLRVGTVAITGVPSLMFVPEGDLMFVPENDLMFI